MYRTLTIRNIKQNPTAIAAAVLCIGLITVLAGPWDRVANHATAIASSPKMLTILVASHVLPAGSEIGPDDFTVKQVMGLVPADAVSSGSEIIGRITAKQYAAKEVFSRESLRDPSTLGIAAHVRPGQRAFSIRIAEDEIVGGFLQSGDHVDVFATIPGSVFPTKDSADVPDRSSAVLLLQNIAVLAVGENPATRGSIQSSARTVSLELTPEGLSRLALAERYGKVSLAIRKPGDNSVTKSVSAVLADIVPVGTHESAPAPAFVRMAEPRKRQHSFGIPFFSGARAGSLSLGGSR
jgi:pilus assembly protein CpaB